MLSVRLISVLLGIVFLVKFGWLIFEQARTNIKTDTFKNVLENTVMDTTVVTAYFDLGAYRKGPPGNYRTPETYFNWSKIFQYVVNPLVVYTDSEDFKQHMMDVRNVSMNYTKILLVKRSSSWAFDNIERIREIFMSKHYFQNLPVKQYPAYACVSHAKFDVLGRATERNFFSTKYFMWLDIGYFRNRKTKKLFYLQKPQDFDESKIAMNLIKTKEPLTINAETIFKRKLFWVGGGLVFGDKERIIKFAAQFRRAVKHFLSKGLANTEEQVIYAMFLKSDRQMIKSEVELQCYKSRRENDWFYLGNIMARELILTSKMHLHYL